MIFGNGIAVIPSAHSAARVGKKKIGNCGNAIAENEKKKKCYEICERVKKKVVTSIIFLQHFHNKSHIISYY